MAQHYVDWEHYDVAEEDCCMKETFKKFMKKTTGIKLQKHEAMALCIYHFTFNMLVCALAMHYQVAYHLVKWPLGDYLSEITLQFLAIFINVMILMQLAEEMGKIMFAVFFCKKCPMV